MEPMLTVALLTLYLFCDLCGINPPIFVLVIYGCITALFGVLMLRVLSAIWTVLLVANRRTNANMLSVSCEFFKPAPTRWFRRFC
jgi:hypothetical protein